MVERDNSVEMSMSFVLEMEISLMIVKGLFLGKFYHVRFLSKFLDKVSEKDCGRLYNFHQSFRFDVISPF